MTQIKIPSLNAVGTFVYIVLDQFILICLYQL